MRGDARRELFAEREALHLRAALELVQADLGAADRAAERLRVALGVAEVVAVGEDDLVRSRRALEPLEAFARHQRVDDDPGGLDVERVDGDPDSRVDRRPVVDAREHLADRAMRGELERERADELRPRRHGEVEAVASVALQTIEHR